MPNEHVADLFSAAVDRQLTPEQDRRFRDHVETCAQCSEEYVVFRRSVDAVRALPHARMPIPVHVPAGAPAHEQQRFRALLRRVMAPRFLPGAATGVAAVAAAVILVLATRGMSSTTTQRGGIAAQGGALTPATQAAGSCTPVAGNAVAVAPPSGFQNQRTATDPGRPGQTLVLATAANSAAPGSTIQVFAQLSVPRAGAAAPGAAASTLTQAATPCLSVASSGHQAFAVAPITSGSAHGLSGAPDNTAEKSAPPGLESIAIPANTPRGTVLHITATVPAGFPTPGEGALTVELTLTVQ